MLVSAPQGWTTERLVLADPSGAVRLAVTVEASAAPDGAAVAAARADAMGSAFPGYREEALRTLAVGPTEVVVRRYSWAAEDQPRVTNAQLYRAGGGRAIVGTLGSLTDLPEAAEQIAARLLAGLELREDPGVRSFGYTSSELTALAELLGAGEFPGTGEHRFATAAERSEARRALTARGSVRQDAEGRPAISAAERPLLEIALWPRTAFSAERRRDGREERRAFYAARTMSVAHAVSGAGVHYLTVFPTRELEARLLGFLELRARPVGAREPFTLPAAEYERAAAGRLAASNGLSEGGRRLAETLGPASASSRLRLVRRSDRTVTGGEVAWLDTGDAGLWLVESRGAEVSLVPVSAQAVLERVGAL
jgi:hypothetical protein